MTDVMINNALSSLLFNLRCQCVNIFKGHFKGNNIFLCPLCETYEDTQEHALNCEGIKQYLSVEYQNLITKVQYSDIYGSVSDQLRVTKVFCEIIKARERLQPADPEPASQGNNTGPSD